MVGLGFPAQLYDGWERRKLFLLKLKKKKKPKPLCLSYKN